MADAARDGATAFPAPRDLTLPVPGSDTARRIFSLALRRLVRELVHAHDVAHGPARHRPEVAALRRTVADLARSEPGVVAHLARLPTVGVFVRCLRRAGAGGDLPEAAAAALQTELSATLAAELALAGRLPGSLRLERFPARIVALGARRVLDVPEGTAALDLEAGRIVATGPGVHRTFSADDSDLSRFFHPIDDDWLLAEVDNNPLAMEEAHPDKAGNALDLGGRPAGEWVAALSGALDLVAAHLPELHEEMRLVVRQVVPVGYHAQRHLSASYQEAIGTVYLSLHPSPMTMVEAVVHEFSHNKLAALFELDPVLENAFHPLYTSPVRPDPRPLHGILLAAHAFVPVARLYERMKEAGHPLCGSPGFDARLGQIVKGNREGIGVLASHARPTAAGRPLLEELRAWDAHFEGHPAGPP